jgi:hypothetical protein
MADKRLTWLKTRKGLRRRIERAWAGSNGCVMLRDTNQFVGQIAIKRTGRTWGKLAQLDKNRLHSFLARNSVPA